LWCLPDAQMTSAERLGTVQIIRQCLVRGDSLGCSGRLHHAEIEARSLGLWNEPGSWSDRFSTRAPKDGEVSVAATVEGGKPNGPRSRKGAKTRARLVAAAKEIFEESGFLDARISDIADRAGLSHGSFYHYFDSKEEIFREVAATVDELLSEPQRTVALAPSFRASPRERIHEAIRRYLSSYREEAKIIGVVEQVSLYDTEVAALRHARHHNYQQDVAESIRQLQMRGRADPNLDPKIAAAILGAMTTRFAEAWLVEEAVNCRFDDAVEQLTILFVNALGMRFDGEAAPSPKGE